MTNDKEDEVCTDDVRALDEDNEFELTLRGLFGAGVFTVKVQGSSTRTIYFLMISTTVTMMITNVWTKLWKLRESRIGLPSAPAVVR